MDNNTTPEIQEIVSRPNDLKLVKVEIDSYAGIDATDKALVIVFPENEKITELSGDQGVGKTSLMNGLKALLGEPEPENSINQTTKNKSMSLEFEKDGELYKTRLTKSAFTLTSIKEKDGNKMTSTINKPKEMLSKLIGPVGVSPSFVKEKKSGESQLEWIKSLAKSNPELSAQENAIKAAHALDYAKRTDVNRDVKNLKQSILNTGYYSFSDDGETVHTAAVNEALMKIADAPENEEVIQEEFKAAQLQLAEKNKAISRREQLDFEMKTARNEVERLNNEIARLQAQVLSQNKKIADTDDAIVLADAYIKERDNAPQRMEAAQQAFQNFNSVTLLRKGVFDAAELVKTYKTKEEEQKALIAKLDQYEAELRELAQQFTPDIEGLEIELGNSIDNKRQMGVYYKGTNIAFLSESELWDLCLQVWKVSGISVVFIENSTSLGSDAMERINWFAKNGGTVFLSTVQRGYKELKVTFLKEKQ